MGKYSTATRNHMVGRGERRHRCEECGRVFTCGPCTRAFHRSQFASNKVCIGDRSFIVIYTVEHMPRNQMATSMQPWLCEACK